MIGQVVSRFKSPLLLNGYMLVFSSGVTSLLGFVYWVLAARLYSEQAVGLNSAAIGAMFFLVSMAQLNLVHALNRFVPSAGRETAKLILGAYLANIVLVIFGSLIFIAGLEAWAPSLSTLGSDSTATAWFIFATVCWCVFTLQDGALIGLGQSKWVLYSNAVYALIKLGLIALLAFVSPGSGIFLSWTLPVLLVILPVNVLIFARLIPAHVRATQRQGEPVALREIIRFVAGNYVSSLAWTATLNLLPVLIVERVGATSGAHFYMAWSIAYTLYLATVNMGMSLVTEASKTPDKLNAYSYKTLWQTLQLIVPLVAAVLIGAPYLLRLFGDSYEGEGATLLRLLSLSALPYVVVTMHMSMARVRRNILSIFWTYSALCALVLVCSHFFLNAYGVVGIGWAWLVSQSIVALVLLATHLRVAWLPFVGFPRFLAWPLKRVKGLFWELEKRQVTAKVQSMLPMLEPQFDSGTQTERATWQVAQIFRTVGDTKVVKLSSSDQQGAVILKLAASQKAQQSFLRYMTALSHVHANPALEQWSRVTPQVLTMSNLSQAYMAETMVPGKPAETFVRDPRLRERALDTAVQSIHAFHQYTAREVVVDDEVLRTWLEEPLVAVRRITTDDKQRAHVEALTRTLRDKLLGRTVVVSWSHGDFSPQNVLLDEDASKVTGIVDWEHFSLQSLPVLDSLHLVLATFMLVERKEFGELICTMLDGRASGELWHLFERFSSPELNPSGIDGRTLLLLCWLSHVKNATFGGALDSPASPLAARFWAVKNLSNVIDSALATGQAEGRYFPESFEMQPSV